MKKIFFIIYPLFLLSFTIFSYTFIDPNLFYLKFFYSGFAFQSRLLATIFYLVFIFLFFVFYFFFLWRIYQKQLDNRNIKWLIGITLGILFFSYPAMLSYDIFNYIFTSKVLFFYHENPYIIMPIEFIGDPLLLFTHAANKIALYGPVWILLTGIPHLVGFGNFLLTLFAFKLLMIFFYLATIFLIWKLSKNLLSVALFSLNPLIVIETLLSDHNDIAMMFFALLAFYFLMKKKYFKAFTFLFLSILIKYATLFLIPVFIFACFQKIKNQKISTGKIFYFSALSMLAIFFLSPFREEIYPWYAIWFLTFASLIPQKRILLVFSLTLSGSLLLRYTPFMLTGNYFGQTPLIKIIATFVPLVLVFVYLIFKEKIWLKRFYRY